MSITGMIIISGSALAAVLVPVGAIALREGILAYRETQERQHRLHPDPEAERAQVDRILARRRQELEDHLQADRTDTAAGVTA